MNVSSSALVDRSEQYPWGFASCSVWFMGYAVLVGNEWTALDVGFVFLFNLCFLLPHDRYGFSQRLNMSNAFKKERMSPLRGLSGSQMWPSTLLQK